MCSKFCLISLIFQKSLKEEIAIGTLTFATKEGNSNWCKHLETVSGNFCNMKNFYCSPIVKSQQKVYDNFPSKNVLLFSPGYCLAVKNALVFFLFLFLFFLFVTKVQVSSHVTRISFFSYSNFVLRSSLSSVHNKDLVVLSKIKFEG